MSAELEWRGCESDGGVENGDAMETLQIRARLVFHCIPAYCRLFEASAIRARSLFQSIEAFCLRFLSALSGRCFLSALTNEKVY